MPVAPATWLVIGPRITSAGSVGAFVRRQDDCRPAADAGHAREIDDHHVTWLQQGCLPPGILSRKLAWGRLYDVLHVLFIPNVADVHEALRRNLASG